MIIVIILLSSVAPRPPPCSSCSFDFGPDSPGDGDVDDDDDNHDDDHDDHDDNHDDPDYLYSIDSGRKSKWSVIQTRCVVKVFVRVGFHLDQWFTVQTLAMMIIISKFEKI